MSGKFGIGASFCAALSLDADVPDFPDCPPLIISLTMFMVRLYPSSNPSSYVPLKTVCDDSHKIFEQLRTFSIEHSTNPCARNSLMAFSQPSLNPS